MVTLHYLMHCVFNWHTYPEGPGEGLVLFFFVLVRHTGMNLTLYFFSHSFPFPFSYIFSLHGRWLWWGCMLGVASLYG